MFCSHCGSSMRDGDHFCSNCGASLLEPGGTSPHASAPQATPGRTARSPKQQDPYKEQIAQLKLQIRQSKLYLKQLTTGMSTTRASYNETAAFVPEGLLRHGYKWLEDIRLLGPQQQKQQLQQQILQFEQELLGLQQAQAQWKAQM